MGATPYYSQDGIVVIHGDSRDVLPSIPPNSVDLVLTDPPYGIGLDTENRSRKRGALAEANDYAPVFMDNEPFDPAPLLRFPRLVLFGANHYASRLPESSSWLVWDKTAGLHSDRAIGFNDNADAELIWTNLGGQVRVLKHRWIGMMKATERGDSRLHPTQKPVALMRHLIEMFGNGGVVLDPYMGSGSTLRAAKDLGIPCVGIEISEKYCEIAATRLQQQALALA